MGAVWIRARAELRSRWRAWLALAIVFGIASGAAIAAAAGARRTDSAYPRFVEEYEGYDAILGGIASEDDEEIARVRKLITNHPDVAEAGQSQFVAASIVLPSGVTVTFPEVVVIGDVSGSELVTVNRAKITSGRMFNLNAPDEAVITFTTADRLDIAVGDRIGIVLGDPFSPGSRSVESIRIVGEFAAPGVMPSVGQFDLGGIDLSPAFMRKHEDKIQPTNDAPSVRLKEGVDLDDFIERIKREASSPVDVPVTLPTHVAGVQKTLRFEAQALWILAGLIGLAAVAILGQAIARQVTAESDDHRRLLAIGMSPRQLIVVGMLRAAVVAAAAAVVALASAIAASMLTPIGLSRVVEPDPGVRFDATAILLGCAATILAVMVIAVLPTWRGAVLAARAEKARPARSSKAVAAAGAMGAGPSAVAGLRLAFETGRGARAVPLRSALLGIALAVGAFVAAGTFSSSLDHLIATPSLYGYDWDAITTSEGEDGDATVHDVLRKDPDVAALSYGGAANIQIGDKRLIPLTYEPGRGIEPTVLAGRPPREADEIALGGAVLDALRKKVGDTVPVQAEIEEGPRREPAQMKIVGESVVPSFFFEAVQPGESSAITNAAWGRLSGEIPDDPDQLPAIVRFKQGTDINEQLAELQDAIPGLFTFQVRRPGADLFAVSRSSSVPIALTQVLLLMALATLVHVLVTSVRKRRHDLAILKTLGFVRSQLSIAVAWQATALTVIAVLIGIPVGFAVGRWAWHAFARSLGVVSVPHVSPIAFVLIPIVAVTVANMIAAVPARAASRTQAAVVLRAE